MTSLPPDGQLDLDGRSVEVPSYERAGHGERVRLFEPAPAQLAGQTDFLAALEVDGSEVIA